MLRLSLLLSPCHYSFLLQAEEGVDQRDDVRCCDMMVFIGEGVAAMKKHVRIVAHKRTHIIVLDHTAPIYLMVSWHISFIAMRLRGRHTGSIKR